MKNSMREIKRLPSDDVTVNEQFLLDNMNVIINYLDGMHQLIIGMNEVINHLAKKVNEHDN